jgi:hypothetical protein
VYNLATPQGFVAAFGIPLIEERFVQHLKLAGTGGSTSSRLNGTLPLEPVIVDVEEEIWGVPADPAHDQERVCQGANNQLIEGCSAGVEKRPLLTLPASCAEPLRATVTGTSLGPPSQTSVASAVSRDAGGNPQPLVGCEAVPFDPGVTFQTDAAALALTALTVGVEIPQHEAVGVTPAAPLAGLDIALPAGLAINPSAGPWLSGCPPAAIGLESPPGVEPPVFGEGPTSCPASARLGSVTLGTPLVDHGLSGSIYLATSFANPFATRFAIYLVIEDEATGTILKIPGRLDADPAEGRLTATIPELPPLPFSDLELEFAGGPRAPLVNLAGCGRYATEATFTPSTAPFGVAVTRRAGFTISEGAGGTPCPPAEAERNAAPSFRAGTEVPVAGGSSPLSIHLSREDVDQRLGSFELTLPPGLTANLGSAPLGAAVGSVKVEAGLGPRPLALSGTVYLEGPYQGAPYSLKIVVPAQAGPFDLGTIVQRAALSINPDNAQISVRSDPFPQILAGVPLELRGLTVDLDRPGFIRNPTSCEPMAIAGSATTSLGQVVPLSDRFQVGDCAALPFNPKLAISLSGAIGRNGHPALRAVLRGDPDGAAPASMELALPGDELLDLRHIGALCSRGLAPDRCPPGSRLGGISFEGPFLATPLAGSVYLRAPKNRLPGLVADLRSGPLHLEVDGQIATAGRLSVRFPSIPDIPLSKAVLSLVGGRRGIIVNSRALCSRPSAAEASVSAHSGKRRRLRVPVRLGSRC